MKHYGDITKINGASVEPVDIITGGSPCQDLSVAGKRAGLAGERSGLFMEQIRIIKEMREHDIHSGRAAESVRPRYMVWENVPGAFSSNGGEDFRAVLEETARVVAKDAVIPGPPNGKWSYAGCILEDGWSIAWRTHDAQYWGVPQRRKRISLVADFGGTAAPEILFECESMSRNSEQGEQTRQGAAGSVGERTSSAGAAFAAYDARGNGDGKTAGTLTGDHENRVTDYTTICVQGNAIDRQPQNGPCGKGVTEDVSFTLNTVDRHAVVYKKTGHPQNAKEGQGYKEADIHDTLNCFENGESRASAVVLENHPQEQKTYQKVTGTLSPGSHPGGCNGQDAYNDMLIVDANSVAYGLDRASYNQGKNAKYGFSIDKEKIGAQTAMGPGAVFQSVVRRLTPKECERLQGFPDDWTNIGDWKDSKGKLHKGESDSPRYKALGNSIALPFWQWLAERIAKHLPQGATMASLFDGIGGFPLSFSRAGVKPVWASEIEEFPIAVTKIRFPEEGDGDDSQDK